MRKGKTLLSVGPYNYSLIFTSGPIMKDGEELLGICVEHLREILISAECPPRERVGMIMKQLVYAWIYATGEPHGRHEWSDLVATVALSFRRDLDMYGGEKNIDAIAAEQLANKPK